MSDVNTWMALRSAMQDDGRPRRAVDRATWGRVAAFARPHRKRISGYLVLSTISAGLGVLIPVLAGIAVDEIVDGSGVGVVVGIAVAIAVVSLLDSVVGVGERFVSARLGEEFILDLRRRVFDHVQSLPVAFFNRTRTGALVSRLNNDVIGAQRAFTSALAGIVTNVIVVALTVAVMARLSWPITLLAVVLLPLFVVPARRVGAKVGALDREAAEHNAAMTSQMSERFSAPGATLVKLFGRPAEESEAFGARAGRVRDIGVRTAVVSAVFMRSLSLVSGLALALIYGLGGVLAVRGQLDAGTIVTLALLVNRLYAPLTALATARLDVVTAMVSFERVFEVLDIEPLIREPERPRPLPPGPVSVELDHVRFAYPAADRISLASLEEVSVLDDRLGREVLHDVSLHAGPGRTVALVGPSGAGKSTIASLVPRLYDVDAGAVRIGGVDVRDLSFADLQRAVGVVTQDGHLFHDTVRANLLYAAPAADTDELWHALSAARLDEVIRSLPDGLDTVLGERGYRLSGGERQRLTIARLLLAGPRVVVLDEATAHLDAESEHAVQEALAVALAGRTAIVIAHRLSTIRSADEICVVEGGRVVEQGTHAELLARDGRYADLYRTQYADQDVVP
ncbi:ABC transporter ATP-binding protein [Dermatobacter hominis]|uniref:ABC transporter ATP-binding protein n=1 Tax=Dermatobacter hominis TaxID=2884263 RepID=UPI001D1155B6|nr:ABC transporter ATP-binding protein [Dermatobacter hominis]UDY36599.1 ABC transporter ATP-binding protein/permease [Dermatobacter hominis]